MYFYNNDIVCLGPLGIFNARASMINIDVMAFFGNKIVVPSTFFLSAPIINFINSSTLSFNDFMTKFFIKDNNIV